PPRPPPARPRRPAARSSTAGAPPPKTHALARAPAPPTPTRIKTGHTGHIGKQATTYLRCGKKLAKPASRKRYIPQNQRIVRGANGSDLGAVIALEVHQLAALGAGLEGRAFAGGLAGHREASEVAPLHGAFLVGGRGGEQDQGLGLGGQAPRGKAGMGGQPVQHGLRGTGCGFVQDTQLQAEPVRQVNGAGRNIPPPSAFAPAHTMKPAPWIFLPLALLAGCRVQTVPPTAAVAQAAPAAAPTPVEQPVPESCAMLTPEQYRVL